MCQLPRFKLWKIPLRRSARKVATVLELSDDPTVVSSSTSKSAKGETGPANSWTEVHDKSTVIRAPTTSPCVAGSPSHASSSSRSAPAGSRSSSSSSSAAVVNARADYLAVVLPRSYTFPIWRIPGNAEHAPIWPALEQVAGSSDSRDRQPPVTSCGNSSGARGNSSQSSNSRASRQSAGNRGVGSSAVNGPTEPTLRGLPRAPKLSGWGSHTIHIRRMANYGLSQPTLTMSRYLRRGRQTR